MVQLHELRALWQREVSEAAELRTSLVTTTAALAGAEDKVSLYTDLLRCLISVHRGHSREAMCLTVAEHFKRLFSAARVTLFLVDLHEAVPSGGGAGLVGGVDGLGGTHAVGVGEDLGADGGGGATVWTAVTQDGDQFSVPLEEGPVSAMLRRASVMCVRRGDIINQYMRSLQRTQYAAGEVRELMACPLRDGNGRVVGFLEALNHHSQEAGADDRDGGFDETDQALLKVAAMHVATAVSRCGDLEFANRAVLAMRQRLLELESLATEGVTSSHELLRASESRRVMIQEFSAAWSTTHRAVSTRSMFLTAAALGETVFQHLEQVSCTLYVAEHYRCVCASV